MFSKEDHEFIDFLFGKLLSETDTDMIDLHDDDSCCDHLEFEQLSIELSWLTFLRLQMKKFLHRSKGFFRIEMWE